MFCADLPSWEIWYTIRELIQNREANITEWLNLITTLHKWTNQVEVDNHARILIIWEGSTVSFKKELVSI